MVERHWHQTNGHGSPGWECKRNLHRLTIYVKAINDVFLLFFWNRWYYLIKTYSWTMHGQHCPRAGYLKNDERTSRVCQRVEGWPWLFLAQTSWIVLRTIRQGKHVAGQSDKGTWFVYWSFGGSWCWNWIKKPRPRGFPHWLRRVEWPGLAILPALTTWGAWSPWRNTTIKCRDIGHGTMKTALVLPGGHKRQSHYKRQLPACSTAQAVTDFMRHSKLVKTE